MIHISFRLSARVNAAIWITDVQHLLSSFSSPCFRVKIVYNYGLSWSCFCSQLSAGTCIWSCKWHVSQEGPNVKGIENSSSIFNRLLELHNPTYPYRITASTRMGWNGVPYKTSTVYWKVSSKNREKNALSKTAANIVSPQQRKRLTGKNPNSLKWVDRKAQIAWGPFLVEMEEWLYS
jgi:hypothetical protein